MIGPAEEIGQRSQKKAGDTCHAMLQIDLHIYLILSVVDS